MTDVFVSYKAEDRARVAPLVRALEGEGISVWWDAHIGAGDDWRETILRNLERAKCVIVIWSRRSVGTHGQFVRDEATRAVRRKSYLPVRIDKVDPPLGFGETQAHDLVGWKGDVSDDRFKSVLAALENRFKIRPNDHGVPPLKPNLFSRRGLVMGGAAVLVGASGIGTWIVLRPNSTDANSIAVLPFENLSGDPSQAYFSDGIAEELRSALARIPGFKVVARTSSEAVRNDDAKTAAQKLGVTHILTGSVRRSAALLRISAQLVDAQGLEQWSEAYDRPAGDALRIQADIANNVADAMRIRLGGLGFGGLREGGTTNPEAYDLLLKAQALLQLSVERANVEHALDLLNGALALDPRYGDATAWKASAQTLQAGMNSASAAESQRTFREAKATAQAAILLAPHSRLGYAALASILDQQLEFRDALNQYQRMLRLPGNDADLALFAVSLSEFRHFGQALALIDRAIVADPLNPGTIGWKASILLNSRRYADAAATIQHMIALDPTSRWAHSFHAYCVMLLGNNDAARREFDAIGSDNARGSPAYLGALAARQGDIELANQVLAGMREHADAVYFQFAEVYAQLGKKDEAINALQNAYGVRDPGLSEILVDPLLDPIRNDPRFSALVRRLDFPT